MEHLRSGGIVRKFDVLNPCWRSWAVVVLCFAFACADEHEVVHVEGNVVAVSGAPPTARRVAPQGDRALAALRFWLGGLWASPAVAQSSCGAAVEGVLACLATQGAGPTFGGTCARVRSNCEFEVDIELAAPGDSLFLFFCFDASGNGSCEPNELSAPYLNFDKVGNFCNGDVLRVTSVSIDFTSQTCSGSPSTVVADGCAPPDPTAAAATPTRRPGEPEPPGGGGGPSPTLPPGVTPSPTTPAPATPVPTATRTPTGGGGPGCRPEGGPCNDDGDCCSGTRCAEGSCEACVLEGATCPGDPPRECCSAANTCQLGVCAPCSDLGEGCASNSECCGQAFCGADICEPCFGIGEGPCTVAPCCPNQGVCFEDTCQFCSLTGTGCGVSPDCCEFGAGVDCNGGTCSACADPGEACSADSDCCERPDSFLVCEPGSFTCQPTV